jgi:hypothetical protein
MNKTEDNMKNIKKIKLMLLVLSLTLCTTFAFVSCGDDNETDKDNSDNDGNTPGEDDGKITYTVTVKDEAGNAIKGVKVQLKLDNVAPIGNAVTTGDDGVATFSVKNEGAYFASVSLVPQGFVLPESGTKLVDNAATVILEKLPEYTVYVKDASGNAIAGVGVQICSLSGACQLPKITDAEGKIVSNLAQDSYQAKITSAPDEYVYTAEYFILTDNTVTIILQAK